MLYGCTRMVTVSVKGLRIYSLTHITARSEVLVCCVLPQESCRGVEWGRPCWWAFQGCCCPTTDSCCQDISKKTRDEDQELLAKWTRVLISFETLVSRSQHGNHCHCRVAGTDNAATVEYQADSRTAGPKNNPLHIECRDFSLSSRIRQNTTACGSPN